MAEAISAYKEIRGDLAEAVPFWPLGLPGWTDPWVALGMRVAPTTKAYLVVWHRGRVARAPTPAEPAMPSDPSDVVLPVAHLRGRPAVTRVLYPVRGAAGAVWSPATGELTATLPHTPSACLIELR